MLLVVYFLKRKKKEIKRQRKKTQNKGVEFSHISYYCTKVHVCFLQLCTHLYIWKETTEKRRMGKLCSLVFGTRFTPNNKKNTEGNQKVKKTISEWMDIILCEC